MGGGRAGGCADLRWGDFAKERQKGIDNWNETKLRSWSRLQIFDVIGTNRFFDGFKIIRNELCPDGSIDSCADNLIMSVFFGENG